MKTRRFPALAALVSLALALLSAPAAVAATSGRGGDESWVHFQSGKRLYEERRFGESLEEFQAAISSRKAAFETASDRVRAALALREAKPAKDNLSHLIHSLARRDLIDHDLAELEASSGPSLRREAELLEKRELSNDFKIFLDALLLVLDHRSEGELENRSSALVAACSELERYPEAEYWVGKIYLAEGELRLAELQFQRAYDMRADFEIPEDSFTVLAALVGVYRAKEDWRAYEDSLTRIAVCNPIFTVENRFLREAMERSLSQDGMDKFMLLYRVKDGAWTGSEAELGEFYLRSGRPQALIYLAASVNEMLTKAIGRIATREPSYVFTTLAELLGRIRADRELSAYARDAELYRELYYLGEALAANGYRDSARSLFAVMGSSRGMEPWDSRARAAAKRKPGSPAPLY
jgi:tetratricopeptide (TPR) repeat protein